MPHLQVKLYWLCEWHQYEISVTLLVYHTPNELVGHDMSRAAIRSLLLLFVFLLLYIAADFRLIYFVVTRVDIYVYLSFFQANIEKSCSKRFGVLLRLTYELTKVLCNLFPST